MPRVIKAFACVYKCGRKVTTNRKIMEEHEARCFGNPARRACKTCSHLKTDYRTVYDRHHGGNPGSSDWEAKYYYCDVQEDLDLRERLQHDCGCWELKEQAK